MIRHTSFARRMYLNTQLKCPQHGKPPENNTIILRQGYGKPRRTLILGFRGLAAPNHDLSSSSSQIDLQSDTNCLSDQVEYLFWRLHPLERPEYQDHWICQLSAILYGQTCP